MAEIQKVSVKHEAIMDYLIANPQIRLQDVAMYFKMTQSWLSQVIHSDAFQAMLREKQNTQFHHTVLPIREKMHAIAHMALDKLAEQLPMETETKTTAQVMESVLDRLGYGTKTAPGVQINNTTNVQVAMVQNEMKEARDLLIRAAATLPKEIEHGADPTASKIQSPSLPFLGHADPLAAFSSIEPSGRPTEVGSQV